MSDALRGLFDSLRIEADVQRLVLERRQESLYLEFKEKRNRRNSDLDQEDRKNFSKGLSAFANAAGGVLVFGVETRKAPDAPDRAAALKPITGAGGLLAKLKDSVLTTTQPVVDDVELRLIAAAEAEGAGYVTCLVPQSDKPPHRAMVDREYYRRTDNGCRKLEHLDLEDMFGRRPRPLLHLRLEVRPRPAPDPHEEVHVFILNEGRAVARFAGFLGTVRDPAAVVVGGAGAVTNASAINVGLACFQFIENVGVIHPNGLGSAVGHALIKRTAKGEPLKLHMRWYCDGMRARAEEVELTPGEPFVLK